MAKIDHTYHRLLNEILEKGYEYEDPNRKGITRLQIPSYTLTHKFKDGFPAITTKKLAWKAVVSELLWFLRGSSNLNELHESGNHIWDKDARNYYNASENADASMVEFLEEVKKHPKDVDLGRIYGVQWREWTSLSDLNGLDQITKLVTNMIHTPMSTQLIVTAWNPAELSEMALPPCHWSFQIIGVPLQNKKYGFYVKWNQRSVDSFLGLPFNIASYALLAKMLGLLTGHKPLGIIGALSNVHIYNEHLSAVQKQLLNDCNKHKKCELDCKIISEEVSEYKLKNYQSYGAIKAPMLAYNK